jgi:thiol-disulfide isomerase/thioredoxin
LSEITPQNIDEVSLAGEGRTVVLFTQPATCGPCRQFKPHWDRTVENVDEITFLYVDLDVVPESMVVYDVMRVPTVKLFDNGEYVRDVKAPQGAIPFINDIRS